ncbi:hypothetical protein SUNI508_09731 [Seiridium unicorne]|uniref:FYVE-type domain-containing protein n=1 Tax=Seiridium unicorne TaxID=138068 RepID=A0ABR2UNZ3_9PEZI
MPRLPDQQQQPYAAHFYPHLSQQQPQSHFTTPSHALQTQTRTQTQTQTQTQAQQQLNSGPNSRQISPLSTSNNTSPTSPKSYHGRQLRPLYMPAVLRPTDYPSKRTPTKKADDQDDDSLKASSSWTSLAGLGALGRLTRRSTGDSGKCMDGELNLDMFPKPTAEPTRKHWKPYRVRHEIRPPNSHKLVLSKAPANMPPPQPDTEASICDEPSCMRHFNYWTRRHHCRKCGNIFCDNHSSYDVPLDQDANYNPRGTPSRACSHCHTEFEVWRSRTNSQASSDDASSGSQTAPASPIAAGTPTAINASGKDQLKAEVAASVPRDWNWSTF